MHLKLTDDAIEDLKWATQYYSLTFPNGRSSFIKNYKTTKMLLSENPYLGRKYERIETVRVLNVVKTPFAIFYKITDKEIQILRVWDQRQDGSRQRL